MCAIYGNIYHQYTPNVSIYTIHGSYGLGGRDYMSMVHPLSMQSNSVGSQLSKQSQLSISVMLQGTKVNHQLEKAGSMERLERLALTPLDPLGLHRCCHSASESTIGCS